MGVEGKLDVIGEPLQLAAWAALIVAVGLYAARARRLPLAQAPQWLLFLPVVALGGAALALA